MILLFWSYIKERTKRKKPFIITTNLSPENILDRYEERIFSRIFIDNTRSIEFPDQDFRK